MAFPSLTQVVTGTDTFGSWVTDYNASVACLQTNTISTAATSAGALTTGNAYVNGQVAALLVATLTLAGGNNATAANLTITTNTNFGNSTVNVFVGQGSLIVNGIVSINSSSINVGSNVWFTTTVVQIGNSTVNTQANSTLISTGTANLSNQILIGANVSITTAVATLGNSTVNAILNSTTFELRTSTSTLLANSSDISLGANVILNDTSFFIGNSTSNSVVNSTGFYYDGSQLAVAFQQQISQTLSGASSQQIDSLVPGTYRSCEYVLQVTDSVNNNYQLSKVFILHSGGAAFLTEYGIVVSNSALASYSVSVNSTALQLNCTPTTTSGVVKGFRLPITV